MSPGTVAVSTPNLPDTLQARYQLVCDRVAKAAARAGRGPGEIIIVAVTKHADAEQIRALLQLGHRDFGENRVQVLLQHAAIVEEAIDRMRMHPSSRRAPAAVGSLFESGSPLKPVAGRDTRGGVRWHMIGHLQRNKARKIVDHVRLIHSVDSLRLAEELQAIAVRKDQAIDVLLQVNCSGEGQKFGCPLPAAVPLAEQLATMVNIRLRGLMTMAPIVEKPEQARPHFARCRELFEEMRTMRVTEEAPFNILSMGMSSDFEAAIAEGANIVRIGTSIFGESKTPDRAESPEDDES